MMTFFYARNLTSEDSSKRLKAIDRLGRSKSKKAKQHLIRVLNDVSIHQGSTELIETAVRGLTKFQWTPSNNIEAALYAICRKSYGNVTGEILSGITEIISKYDRVFLKSYGLLDSCFDFLFNVEDYSLLWTRLFPLMEARIERDEKTYRQKYIDRRIKAASPKDLLNMYSSGSYWPLRDGAKSALLQNRENISLEKLLLEELSIKFEEEGYGGDGVRRLCELLNELEYRPRDLEDAIIFNLNLGLSEIHIDHLLQFDENEVLSRLQSLLTEVQKYARLKTRNPKLPGISKLLFALAHLDSDYLDTIDEVLLKLPDCGLNPDALEMLSLIGSQRAIDLLVKTIELKNRENYKHLWARDVIRAIGKIKSELAADTLLKIYSEEGHYEVYNDDLVRAIVETKSKQALPFLKKMVRHPELDRRWDAYHSLGELKSVKVLWETYRSIQGAKKSRYSEDKAEIIEVLAGIEGPETSRMLVSALRNLDWSPKQTDPTSGFDSGTKIVYTIANHFTTNEPVGFFEPLVNHLKHSCQNLHLLPKTLELILKEYSEILSNEDLELAAGLSNGTSVYEVFCPEPGEPGVKDLKVDFGGVRQLAKQELLRRGVQA